MRLLSVCFNRNLALFFAAGLCLGCVSSLRAETIEVQAVSATSPGGKNAQVPPSLARLQGDLAVLAFGAFADSGAQNVMLSAANPKSLATVGSFTLEITRQGASKINVVVKEGAKVVLGPISYHFGKERTKQLQLPDGKKTLIVFLTLIKE